jgi:DNA polymerase
LVSKERVKRCSACELHETRKNVVFGEGDADADIIFIGEAPGSNEDLQGRPFVGAAGRILDEMLSAVRLKRESVYITNILKCRPPKNRNPKKDEIDVCAPYLDGQIEAINPKVICTLGNFASEYILEKFGFHPESIGKIHGKTFDLQDLRIVPLYHPATAVYNPGMKAVLIDDIKKTLG